MALPADFMARVVAWPGDNSPGYVNLHWLSPKGPGMRGRPFKHLADFMSFVGFAANKPGYFKELFFCTSVQAETGRVNNGKVVAHRHASKALSYKCLWIDADAGPGKAYPTIAAAIAAVNDFRLKVGLPPPSAIIITGGGIHVYWISHRALTPDEWRPYAEGLKAEITRLGFSFDPISADPVRVLRVPGTFNNKTNTPRPVTLAHLGNDYDFLGSEFMALAAKAPVAPAPRSPVAATVIDAFALPPAFAKGPSKSMAHLDPKDNSLGDETGRRDLPLDKTEILRGCHHFQESWKTHGKSQSQGLWMLNALACTWIEGGRVLFHSLSRAYPSYTREESDKLFDRKVKERAEKDLGWPACKAFESEGANCKKCPFHNRIRSPLNLADRVHVAMPAASLSPVPDDLLDLPDRYKLDGEGRICEVVEKEDRNGNSVTQYVPLFWCVLRGFRAQSGDRKLLFETSLDMGRWGKVEVSEAVDLISEASIIKALREHGVKPNTDVSPKRIITFMTSFMARLDASRARQATLPFGWLREDDAGAMPLGFAYGGRVSMADGKDRLSGYSDKQLENFYSPKGTDEAWWKLLHVVTARQHPALECIIASSFAAPLSYATGQYNGVACAWSPGSGAHKSTSMQLGAAVWGSPKLTKEKPDSSRKGVIHKMSMIKNLPVYWDEINTPELLKSVADILSSTEGSGGSKLTSGRNLHVYDEWQTMMQIGANNSLVEHIINSNTGSDARLQRVFEYQVEKRADTEKYYEIDRLTNALDYNYGHMGLRYSALLGRDVLRIHRMVKDVLERFSTEVSIRSEERFRASIAASTFVGAVLANELGCNFHTEQIWNFLKSEFLLQRTRIISSDVIAGSSDNAQNWFSQFLKTYTDNAIWVNTLPARKPGLPPVIVWVAGVNHLRQRPIHIRLSISDRTIDISRAKFFEWLVFRQTTPTSVLSGLAKHFGATQPGRTNLATGAGVLGGGREPIIRIPVTGPDSPWWNDLHAHTPPDQQFSPVPPGSPVTATVIPIDRSMP
jgi:hypothetical protein